MRTMTPHLEALPPAQAKLWPEMASVPDRFVLYGGTAIALHLGHRQSVDFDFFSQGALEQTSLIQETSVLHGCVVTQRAPNTLSCIVDRGEGPVHLSFFGLPTLRQIEEPWVVPTNGLRIASLLDLAGMKVSVVQLRAEAKDYRDIDAILRNGEVDLLSALGAGLALYGSEFNPQSALKALCYFEDGDVGSLPGDMKERLLSAVGSVDATKIPEFRAQTPSLDGRHKGPR